MEPKSQTVGAERRIISTEIYRRYQNHGYILGYTVGETNWRLLERWRRSRIVRCVNKFHKTLYIEWKVTGWIYMARGETDKKTNDFQARHVVARDLERYLRCIETQREAKVVHKFIPMPQAMKISRSKGSSGERIGKTGENTGLATDESQKRKRGDRRSKEWGQNCTFCVVHGSLSSQDFGVGATVSKIQRSSRTPRLHCERWFSIVCSNYWAGIVSITNDSSKSHGYHIQTARVRWTRADAVSAYTQVKMEDAHFFLRQNVQTFGFVYHETNGLNHGPVWKIQ